MTKEELPPEKSLLVSGTCNHFPVQFEIDTVRLFLGLDELEGADIDALLIQISAKPFSSGYKGWYKGFTITIRETGISIYGSFSNYYCGPTKILPFTDLKKAVIKLETELNLNLQEAKLNRVDVNWNVCTAEPVEAYNKYLFLDLTGFTRLEMSEGVNFQSGSKLLTIYNKTAQLKTKKLNNEEFPPNWLRIEFRILNRVKKKLGITQLKDLFDANNFLVLLEQLKKYYSKIEKRTKPHFDISSVKTQQDYLDVLQREGCEARGGVNVIFKDIEHMDQRKIFKNRNQKCRLRRKLKDLLQSKNVTSQHPLVQELNNKFEADYKNEVFRLRSAAKN